MDGAELDKRVQAMEWLRSDSIGIDQVMDHCEHWDPLVDELAKFALNRYGRRNNNWLKIIPLMMHEMAGQISSLVSSTHDVTVRIDGQKEWQDTMWKAWEDVNTPEQQATPGDDVDVASRDGRGADGTAPVGAWAWLGLGPGMGVRCDATERRA